jgi:hypothetical protein
MCPDTTLLAASVDDTLFPPDARSVDQHVASCVGCAEILDRFRQERAADRAQRVGGHPRRRWLRSALPGLVMLTVAAGCLRYVAGAVTVRDTHTATRDSPPLPLRLDDLRHAMRAVPFVARDERQRAATARAKRPTDDSPHRQVDAPGLAAFDGSAPAAEMRSAEPAATTDLVVRGKHGKPTWRARDGIIEHSVDGGVTWADEYRADRAIVAGAYVAPEVAWLAGADGVILRRTPVGWFEASARADGEIASIRASSPTRASITLVDGRRLETNNGGVAWTEAPPPDRQVKEVARSTKSPKRGSGARRRPGR